MGEQAKADAVLIAFFVIALIVASIVISKSSNGAVCKRAGEALKKEIRVCPGALLRE